MEKFQALTSHIPIGKTRKIIIQDITTSDCIFILSQENTTSSSFKGLTNAIVEKFPYANPLKHNREFGTFALSYPPFEYIINSCGRPTPNVVHIFAQIYPGGPNKSDDSREERLRAFSHALNSFAHYLANNQVGAKTIAVPLGIGCNLAKGKWEDYLGLVEKILGKYELTYYALDKATFDKFPVW